MDCNPFITTVHGLASLLHYEMEEMEVAQSDDKDVDTEPLPSGGSSNDEDESDAASSPVPVQLDEKESVEAKQKSPPFEWPEEDVNEHEALELADKIIESVVNHIQSAQEIGKALEKEEEEDKSKKQHAWSEAPGVGVIKLLPGLTRWILTHYDHVSACVSRKSREVVSKDHADYLSHGHSISDLMWVAAAHLIHVEDTRKTTIRQLMETSATMFARKEIGALTSTAPRYLFSVATLAPVLRDVIREWNRMDATSSKLENGTCYNRLTWAGERLEMLRTACAVTTVTQALYRPVKCDADGTEVVRFNHLCSRLFYWTDLEDAVLTYRPQVTPKFQEGLNETIKRCKRSFYMWVLSQLQFDLERGRDFGDVFRKVVYGFELGAAALLEYRRMHPMKSDIMVRDMQPMAMFMDTDTDLMGNSKDPTSRYDTLKRAFAVGLSEIAKNQSHPLHQALMLSVTAYFFEQVQRVAFLGRYCFFHYNLPTIYKNREVFFARNAFKVPPRERRPRILCTGASVHILFHRKWIQMKSLPDACIAFFVLCKRYHHNELESGHTIADMFQLISSDNLDTLVAS